MALRIIVTEEDPLLRKPSREVKEVTPRIRELIEDMWETMYEANGVGLAAPQVGVLRRVVVIDATPEGEEQEEIPDAGDADEPAGSMTEDSPAAGADRAEGAAPGVDDTAAEGKPLKVAFVNPRLLWVSEEESCEVEGCLSCPGIVGSVRRPERVRVAALDENGEAFELEADGLLAKAICHELDHLEGVLFVDKAEELHEPGAGTPGSAEGGDAEVTSA